ncbi:MAG: hypothetical protein BWY63_03715 [Chloroflexi bacterium ADurb.Bin360]|nr:MAG: hypothetical protein BWY63_03715 [Chloroflexi bacterium ADurb.Bin360]
MHWQQRDLEFGQGPEERQPTILERTTADVLHPLAMPGEESIVLAPDLQHIANAIAELLLRSECELSGRNGRDIALDVDLIDDCVKVIDLKGLGIQRSVGDWRCECDADDRVFALIGPDVGGVWFG